MSPGKTVALALLAAALLVDGLVDEASTQRLQPCAFNELCRCSRSGPDLGLVFCDDVHLSDLPVAINNSKAFALHLRRNQLHRLEENLFRGTGLWRIEIRSNELFHVPDLAFAGLERSLAELLLPWNRLQAVPQRALRPLQRLRVLDLTGNDIVAVERQHFVGVEKSLQTLSLAENSIRTLDMEALQDLQKLERLDLRGNSIMRLTAPATPAPAPARLWQLNLADNALDAIPFAGLASLPKLRSLDLSANRIESTFDPLFKAKLTLDDLVLDDNVIEELAEEAWRNFGVANWTSVRGGRLGRVTDGAFRGARIRRLDLSATRLQSLTRAGLSGLEPWLEHLDLSASNVSQLADGLLSDFAALQTLLLNDNPLAAFDAEAVLGGPAAAPPGLHTLHLSGESVVDVGRVHAVASLRHVALSSFKEGRLTQDDLLGFGGGIESMALSKNGLTSIGSRAFRHVTGLKTLDVSDNRIWKIEDDAFDDVANSLQSLRMASCLRLASLSARPFEKLARLQSLDLSANKLTQVPGNLLHAMRELQTVNLQDSAIAEIPAQLFQAEWTPLLGVVYLGFNQIETIEAQTFADLEHLQQVHLEDNRVTAVQRGAFQNLKCLLAVHLEGNAIQEIQPEAFQDLPQLEKINLAYNQLTTFSFHWFDQVGTLSTLKVDASHNEINELTAAAAWTASTPPPYSSVRWLDLSHNNISDVDGAFFEPVRDSLARLELRGNRLRSVERDVFGQLRRLLWLDLSDNAIYTVDASAFVNTNQLQVLRLDENELTELHRDTWNRASKLRLLNVSHNELRALPEDLLRQTVVDVLDVSHNRLNRFPDAALVGVASTLRYLRASHNRFVTLAPYQLKKLTNLVYLDVSHNNLTDLAVYTFAPLNRLTVLDLSGNDLADLSDKVFDSSIHPQLPLVHLRLAETGLASLNQLFLPQLVVLNVSGNEIASIPSDLSSRFGELRELDLSHCRLSDIDEPVWPAESKLRALHLNGNQMTLLVNDTFANLDSLDYLDIQDLDLREIDDDILKPLVSLTYLAIGSYSSVKQFQLLEQIENLPALRHLDLEVESPTLERQLRGVVPPKLTNVTLRGPRLTTLADTALQDVQSQRLKLTLRDTSVGELPRGLFANLGRVRWLQLDLRHNPSLASVAEPSTTIYPGSASTVFLTGLRMAGDQWRCDCTTGWVEFWLRKWRQHVCSDRCGDYEATLADVRDVACRNRDGRPLLDALKTELECGWSAASRRSHTADGRLVAAAAGLVVLLYSAASVSSLT